jgi:hypothetical protein
MRTEGRWTPPTSPAHACCFAITNTVNRWKRSVVLVAVTKPCHVRLHPDESQERPCTVDKPRWEGLGDTSTLVLPPLWPQSCDMAHGAPTVPQPAQHRTYHEMRYMSAPWDGASHYPMLQAATDPPSQPFSAYIRPASLIEPASGLIDTSFAKVYTHAPVLPSPLPQAGIRTPEPCKPQPGARYKDSTRPNKRCVRDDDVTHELPYLRKAYYDCRKCGEPKRGHVCPFALNKASTLRVRRR